MENTKGGKIFESRARDEKWDRYREGAGPIARMPFPDKTQLILGPNVPQGQYGTFKQKV